MAQRFRLFVILGVAGALSALTPSGGRAVNASAGEGQPVQGSDLRGATTTRLADGRWLVVGGESADGPVVTARIVDARTGASTAVAGLQVARAGHTATLLADGTVLIAGGRGPGAQVVDTAELFDPRASTFAPLSIAGARARLDHTATLLTDGRVLIAGGTGPDGSIAEAEIWDIDRTTSRTVQGRLAQPRARHQAELLADGRVRVSSGVRGNGSAVADDEIFDPQSGTFSPAARHEDDRSVPRLVASMPESGAADVPLDVRIALRFSHPLRVETVSVATFAMSGPDGLIDVTIVPAEQGRLVFVSSRVPLRPDATYTLTIDGTADRRGVPVVPASIVLTTREGEPAPGMPDEEAWTPDGRNWRSQRSDSPWQTLKPLEAAAGVTALSGQVLRLDGRPLADVTLTMEGRSVRTDRTGRFLLLLDGLASGEHTFAIDARTANRPNRTYGFYEVRWKIAAGRTNVLPFTIWSPLIDTAHQVTIPSPTTQETVITTPTMPGLELHLPAGTTIVGEDGKVARTVSLTPIPLDRTPFPLPANATFTMFFTIQPGGAYLRTTGYRGAWLVYPRRTDHLVGTKLPFFNYDPDDKGWYVYGLGTVTATAVVPDPRTRLYAFTGASFDSGATPPAGGATPGGGPKEGDPVDPSTGAFILEKTDLSLPDVMPLALTRTYNSMDNSPANVRPFGIGMTHNFGLFQWSGNDFVEGDLILPDGGRIHFTRISDPNGSWQSTVMENQSAPTAFYKSKLRFDGNAWEYKLNDGTVYIIGHSASLQRIRDRHGNETRLTWSQTNIFGAGTGNLLRVTSPNGRWIAFTYDTHSPVNRITDITDNIGRNVHYTYDASGHLSTVTDPEGNVTTYTWDGNHRMISIKDARDIVYLTNRYDANGRVDKQTMADPTVVYTFAYTTDGSGNITQTEITNPRGYTKRLVYNADHYLTTQIEAVGQPEQRTTTIDRAANSNFVSVAMDALLRRTEYTYDDFGHVQSVKQLADTATPVITSFTYDPVLFQLASVTDPLSHTWTVGFDSQARANSLTDPLSHQTTFVSDAQGRVTSITDGLQHSWTYGYSGADQTSRTDPAGRISRSFFDGAGRVLATTDPVGGMTRYTVDRLNQVRTVTDARGGVTSLDYDPTGRILERVDPLLRSTSYVYDTIDRAVSQIDQLDNRHEYLFDKNGNLTQTVDRKGQITTYTYDALDRLKLVTYADAATVEYVYDAANRVEQIIDSVAGTTTRGYDPLGRLTSETSPGRSVSYTYYLDGPRETMTVAGQPTVTYAYDAAHRLTSITQGTRVVVLTYDAADRRATVTLPNGIVTTYVYDQTNQLTGLTYVLGQTTLGTLTYSYDDAGQRLSTGGTWARTGLPRAVSTATYDAANRVTTWGGVSFNYDATGNLTSDGLRGYLWDARGQLAGLEGSGNATFGYDSTGRRLTASAGGGTREFHYDGANVVLETGARGTVSFMTGGDVDEWLTRTDASGTVSFLADALGSTIAAFDAAGAMIGQKEYEPFGGTREFGDPEPHGRFTGREQDESGLYFYRARYYDAGAGRFISEDPAGPDGFGNAYAYVENGPTNAVDPTGLTRVQVCCRGLERKTLGMRLARFFKHCYIRVTFNDGTSETYGVLGDRGTTDKMTQYPRAGDDRNSGGKCKDVPGTECQKNKLIDGLERAAREETCPSCRENYDAFKFGPDLVNLFDGYNSNTFVYNMILGAGMVPPGMGRAPGYHSAPGNWYP